MDPTALLRWIDPTALLLVLGGSPAVAVLRAPGGLRRGLAALGRLWRADPAGDAQAATMAAGRLEQLTQVRHIVCADRLETAGTFLRQALRRLADTPSGDRFASWAADDLADRARRHGVAIGFWRGVADAAPAMGMIGTVLGLVTMFAAMDDPAAIGPAMATALMATLYGLIAANVIAGPIADRLEALSEAEIAWQRRLLARFETVARAELDRAPTVVAAAATRPRSVA